MTGIPNVGAPAARAFAAAGYPTLEQLLAADEEDLLSLHGVGPKAVKTFKAAADDLGLS